MAERDIAFIERRASELWVVLSTTSAKFQRHSALVDWIEPLQELYAGSRNPSRAIANLFADGVPESVVDGLVPVDSMLLAAPRNPVDVLIAVSNLLAAAIDEDIRPRALLGITTSRLSADDRLQPLRTQIFQSLFQDRFYELSLEHLRWMGDNRAGEMSPRGWPVSEELAARCFGLFNNYVSDQFYENTIEQEYLRLLARTDLLSVVIDAAEDNSGPHRARYLMAAAGILCMLSGCGDSQIVDEILEQSSPYEMPETGDIFDNIAVAITSVVPQEGQFPLQRELAHRILELLDTTEAKAWVDPVENRETVAVAVAIAAIGHVDVAARVVRDHLDADETSQLLGARLALSALADETYVDGEFTYPALSLLAAKLDQPRRAGEREGERGYTEAVEQPEASHRPREMELDDVSIPLSDEGQQEANKILLHYLAGSEELRQAGAFPELRDFVASVAGDSRFAEAIRDLDIEGDDGLGGAQRDDRGPRPDRGPRHAAARTPSRDSEVRTRFWERRSEPAARGPRAAVSPVVAGVHDRSAHVLRRGGSTPATSVRHRREHGSEPSARSASRRPQQHTRGEVVADAAERRRLRAEQATANADDDGGRVLQPSRVRRRTEGGSQRRAHTAHLPPGRVRARGRGNASLGRTHRAGADPSTASASQPQNARADEGNDTSQTTAYPASPAPIAHPPATSRPAHESPSDVTGQVGREAVSIGLRT